MILPKTCRTNCKGRQTPASPEVVGVNNNPDKSSKYLELIKGQILVSPPQTLKTGGVNKSTLLLKLQMDKKVACSPLPDRNHPQSLQSTDVRSGQANWLGPTDHAADYIWVFLSPQTEFNVSQNKFVLASVLFVIESFISMILSMTFLQ